MPLDPRAERLLRMLSSLGGGAAETVEERRRSLESLSEVAGGAAPEIASFGDLRIPTSEGGVAARFYTPPDALGRMLYFHGGGWVAGGIGTHDGVCRRLANAASAEVVAVDYRLAPEHPFPAGLQDAEAAIRWAREGERPLVVAGDSAGANLAAAAVLRLGAGAAPDLLLLICPILDLATESASRIALSDGYFLSRGMMARDLGEYLPGGADLFDPRLSPLHAKDVSALPPTHLHVAEFDPFRDEGLAFGEKLKAAGVDAHVTQHPGMIHYFYALAGAIPYAEGALQRMGAEVRAALAHSRI